MKIDTGLQRVGNEWDLTKWRQSFSPQIFIECLLCVRPCREEILLGDLEIMGRKELGQYMKENMDTEEKWKSWAGIVR